MIFSLSRKSKLNKRLKELQIEIAAEALKFSCDVKSRYEEKMGGELNQMMLNLGALSFFVHALIRLSSRPNSEILRETVVPDTVLELSRLYGEMIGAISPSLAATSEQFVYDHLNIRNAQYSEGTSILGESADDKNSAVWIASRVIGEDVDHSQDLILVMLNKIGLMQAFANLRLPDRLEVMEKLL